MAVEPCPDRRDFLRSCSLLAAVALAAGMLPEEAQAMRWTRALARAGAAVTYPLPAADGVAVDRENGVLLARYQDCVYAFSMICPHQRAAVKWLEKDRSFQCTKHKSRYAPDGDYVSGRATRSLDRHPIHESEGNVVVDSDVLLRADADRARWESAVVRVRT